jgi:hypothetical protein
VVEIILALLLLGPIFLQVIALAILLAMMVHDLDLPGRWREWQQARASAKLPPTGLEVLLTRAQERLRPRNG